MLEIQAAFQDGQQEHILCAELVPKVVGPKVVGHSMKEKITVKDNPGWILKISSTPHGGSSKAISNYIH